jgi:hypothetical protein
LVKADVDCAVRAVKKFGLELLPHLNFFGANSRPPSHDAVAATTLITLPRYLP